MARLEKFKKLRGASVLVIDEVSYEGSSIDASSNAFFEDGNDDEDNAYDIGIQIDHE